jgi:hypothetical protein
MPGDVLTIESANQAALEIFNILSDHDLLRAGGVTVSEPNASIRKEASRAIEEEGNDAIWE